MELILKSLKSKTVQFSIALAVASIVNANLSLLPLSQVGQAFVGCLVAICIVVLRAVTTVPLNQK
jgi:hypothetical protein